MVKKGLLPLFLFSKCLFASLPDPLPDQFYVSQKLFSWASQFDIETKDEKIGKVNRKILSLTVEYEFYNPQEELEAKAKMRSFSWGASFDITDPLEQPLGAVHENIFSLFPTFELVSPEGELLTQASMNFWGTKYLLKDPFSSEQLATLSRSFFRWKEDWTVQIENPELIKAKQIDSRLFILLMAFQSDAETWERQRREAEDCLNLIISPQCSSKCLPESHLTKRKTANLKNHKININEIEVNQEDLDLIENYLKKKCQESLIPKLFLNKIYRQIIHFEKLLNNTNAVFTPFNAPLTQTQKNAVNLALKN